MKRIYVYDIEVYPTYFCCTALDLHSDEYKTFIIDDDYNDAHRVKEFFNNIWVVGYNNLTYDNVIINYIIKNVNSIKASAIYKLSQSIFAFQNKGGSFFKEFKHLIHNKDYKSIDLMRLLFSKKLRVSLKELECSMNHEHVEDLPYEFDTILNREQKTKVLSYNMNDCIATKKLAHLCHEDIKLRKWTLKNFNVEGYSMDGVNLGTEILKEKLANVVGNRDFTKTNTIRKFVKLADVIYPNIKFTTPEFQNVLDRYRNITIKKVYNEEKGKELWSKYKYFPRIGDYKFKFGLGGLHFETKAKLWKTNATHTILSVDVSNFCVVTPLIR